MAITPKPPIESLVLQKAPPLDPVWVQYEQEMNLPTPPPPRGDVLTRQPIYADECRARAAAMMAPGARDHHLSQGISTKSFTVPSSQDDFAIPVITYSPERSGLGPRIIVVYVHGGGLHVGEADSEQLPCRRMIKESGLDVVVYSVGYRLMPQHSASTCLADCGDVFEFVRQKHPHDKLVLVGSSSGGQLAASVSQIARRGSVQGVLLRCPVTSDAFNGPEYVPDRLRKLHTSTDISFQTSLLGVLRRAVPRDGLEKLPLEADEKELRGLPRTWIQVCTNDTLYSDGITYAKALEDAGVEVQIDVIWGWPHTFWNGAPQLERGVKADMSMVQGLRWLAENI